ncbi:hypothetical protein G9A89_001546 [Geosiphon pyriformis]|nr:hypothetical protein G9A89_001546 [Geosiphon pyriformis]
MASVDRIERELGDAKTEYRRCVEELKEKGEKEVELRELKKNLRQRKYKDENEKNWWIENMQELEKQKEKLEEEANDLKVEKNEWKAQVQKLQNSLMEITKIELERPSKRPRIETDKTKFICANLIKPFDTLPTRAGQLPELINAPLLGKLPVINYSDLGKFAQLGDSIYFDEIDRETELALVFKTALSHMRATNGFVFDGWFCEAVSIFRDPKITGIEVVKFVYFLNMAFRDNIWLVRAKHRAYMERNNLIFLDGSAPISVSGLALGFSVGVLKLLGITYVFGVYFGFRKSCLIFSGVDDSMSVHIAV